jgi:RNA polymerase sigma-54 factor
MGPAIALRLRQHLTLTPQVQQALRLLQMSALEFAQEMEQALTSNPFLEESGDAAAAPRESASSVDDVVVPQETVSPGVSDREQEEWAGASDAQPTLQEHLREQLMISQMGSRDRALAHMIVDSLDDDGYFKAAFDELAAMVPAEHDVRPEDFEAALRLRARSRNASSCSLRRSIPPRPGAPARWRSCAAAICSCWATASGRACSTR